MVKTFFQKILDYFNPNKRIERRKKAIFDLEKARRFSEKCDTSEKVKLANYIMEEFGVKKTVEKEAEKRTRANQKFIAIDEDLLETSLLHIARLKEKVAALNSCIKARRAIIRKIEKVKEKWV